MRTTVNLPDDLMRAAKSRAAEEGVTLTQLIAEGLRSRVETTSPQPEFRLRTFRGAGLQPGIDLSDNAATLDLMDES